MSFSILFHIVFFNVSLSEINWFFLCAPNKDSDSQEDGFVSRAFRRAREAADLVIAEKHPKQKKKTEKSSKTAVKKKDCEKKTGKAWYSSFSPTSPLAKFWSEDMKAGKTMSAKNFASRVYHKVDKGGSRADARRAHSDALLFGKSKNG